MTSAERGASSRSAVRLAAAVSACAALALATTGVWTDAAVQLGGSYEGAATLENGERISWDGGWVVNDSPWPVEVVSIETDAGDLARAAILPPGAAPLGAERDGPRGLVDGDDGLPVTLAPGERRHLAIVLATEGDTSTVMSTVTMQLAGPFGLVSRDVGTGIRLVAAPGAPDFTDLEADPAQFGELLDVWAVLHSESGSLEHDGFSRYLEYLRTALVFAGTRSDALPLAFALGPHATGADAERFANEFDVGSNPGSQAVQVDERTVRVQFIGEGSERSPEFDLEWRDHRWRVVGYGDDGMPAADSVG